ncbi:hypothetical protein [Ekhidna sp.]
MIRLNYFSDRHQVLILNAITFRRRQKGKTPLKDTSVYDTLEELEHKFRESPDFQEAFEKLIPKIFEGKGWNER